MEKVCKEFEKCMRQAFKNNLIFQQSYMPKSCQVNKWTSQTEESAGSSTTGSNINKLLECTFTLGHILSKLSSTFIL